MAHNAAPDIDDLDDDDDEESRYGDGPIVECDGPLPYLWYRAVAHLINNNEPRAAVKMLLSEEGVANLNQVIQEEESAYNPSTGCNLSYGGDWSLLTDSMISLLHVAAMSDSEEVLRYLLGHAEIDVNAMPGEPPGRTALGDACEFMCLDAVRVLLLDPRTDVYLTRGKGDLTGFQHVMPFEEGHLTLLKLAIASGRIDPSHLVTYPNHPERCHLEHLRQYQAENQEPLAALMISLLENNLRDPARTRFLCGVAVHWPHQTAAMLFALAVLLCDEHFAVSGNDRALPPPRRWHPLDIEEQPPQPRRFLWMMRRLPGELQMIVSQRATGLAPDNIQHDLRERAFHHCAFLLSTES